MFRDAFRRHIVAARAQQFAALEKYPFEELVAAHASASTPVRAARSRLAHYAAGTRSFSTRRVKPTLEPITCASGKACRI
jgi:hypothetical protein